jgi:hypothetical protein
MRASLDRAVPPVIWYLTWNLAAKPTWYHQCTSTVVSVEPRLS